MMKQKILLILICSTILLVIGCSKKSESNPPIRIALNTWVGYAQAFIAKEKGYFSKNGVEVELVLEKNYNESLQHYNSNETDGIFEVYADAILDLERRPSRVVYVSDYSISEDVIVGKPEFKDLSSLKGKKIGIDGINTFSNIFVIKALEKAGIKEQEVRFEVINAMDIPSSIEKGIIDAGHTWEPAKSKALKMGYKVLANAQYVPGLIVDVLVFNSSVIDKRPKEIKAVIKALFEALDFLQNNKKEARQIMAKYEGMSVSEMDEGLRGISQPDVKENLRFMQKNAEPPSLFSSGQIIIDFYLNRGQLIRVPNLDQLIMPKFIEELGK